MAEPVVVWAVVDTAGRVVTATEYRQNAEEAAGRAHLPCRIVKCVEPVESSGASPDREAVAAVLAQCDADFARDLGAAPAELVGLAGKVVKAVHLRMADAVLSLLGATPREDARDRVIVAAIKETESERNRALGGGTTKIDLDECRFERRRATEALLRFMIARKLGATEPAKEPPPFNESVARAVWPGMEAIIPDGHGSEVAMDERTREVLRPVMDEAATEREVMPNAGTALPQGSANYGVHAVTGAAHPTNTPEAAREAPELCQVLPAGYVVTLNDGNGLNYRMGAPGRVVSYHATRWEAESAAFEAYGRAAWAHGDADAALLAEAHKELSRLHGNLNHTVSLADGCGCRSGRVLAKLDARLGERP